MVHLAILSKLYFWHHYWRCYHLLKWSHNWHETKNIIWSAWSLLIISIVTQNLPLNQPSSLNHHLNSRCNSNTTYKRETMHKPITALILGAIHTQLTRETSSFNHQPNTWSNSHTTYKSKERETTHKSTTTLTLGAIPTQLTKERPSTNHHLNSLAEIYTDQILEEKQLGGICQGSGYVHSNSVPMKQSPP